MLTLRATAASTAVVTVLLLAMAPAVVGKTNENASEKYCSSKGGNVVELKPYLNADTDARVELGGSMKVCQFVSQEGDNPVQVVADLSTVHSKFPTLAGLAYMAKVPSSNSGTAGSNPAASYCPDDLGGTEMFGTQGNGAWVGALDPGMEAGASEPLGDSIVLCVFADRSAIDEWALFYHSAGEVRGTDLTSVMRYQASDTTPEVFATGE
jgi:putative hemolysin